MNELFNTDTLEELEVYLSKQDKHCIREKLFNLFDKYSVYNNVSDWNKAVRLCEALVIVGWGNREPVQALRGQFFNGNPETKFTNKNGDSRFLDAIWSKRKHGLTLETGRASYHYSPDVPDKMTILWDFYVSESLEDCNLESQRNWIYRNPIKIYRAVSNCYEGSMKLNEKLKDLSCLLDNKMKPETYGRELNRIFFGISFSYPGTNYVIASDSIKTKNTAKLYEELQKKYSTALIKENNYFYRHRYTIGNFMKKSGELNLVLHLEQDFSNLAFEEQLENIVGYLNHGVDKVITKLKPKKLNYDLEKMRSDFNDVLSKWAGQGGNVL